MRAWACMVRERDTFAWTLYEVDSDRRYIEAVALELREGGTEAGVMEVY